MGKDIIDQNIKDQLYDYVSYIDNDELWTAINKKRNRNRGGLYLWGLGALILVAFAAYYFVSSDNNTAPIESVLIDSNVETPRAITQVKTDLSTTLLEEKEISQEIRNQETAINTETKTLKQTTKNQNSVKENTIITKSKLTFDNSTYKESFTPSTMPTTKPPVIDKIAIQAKQKDDKTNTIIAKQDLPTLLKVEQLVSNKFSSLSEISLIEMQSILSKRSEEKLSRKVKSTIYELENSKNQLGCYSHKRSVTNMSIFAYSGPEFISRSLSTQSTNPETSEYLKARKDSEVILQGARSGVMVKFNHRSGVYAKLGIEYQRLNERLNFMTMRDSSYVIPNQLIKVDIDSNGDSILTYGPVPVTVVQTKTWINYNKYHFVNIPLLVGYQKEIEKWSFGAELGITFNSKMTFSGMILSDTQSPIDDPNYFKNSIGISLNGGLGVGYQIAPKYKIWATPSIKYDLSKVNQETYPIDQKYRTVGLLAGLELLF